MHTAKSAAILVALITLVAAQTSPEHLLLFCDGMALAAALWLLWPATDAPVLLVPFGLQWLSVAMKPIESALTGQPLDNFEGLWSPLDGSAWFALAGASALGLGMWFASRQKKVDWAESLARDATSWSAGFVIPISLGLIVGGNALSIVAHMTGPAKQIVLAFGEAKNAGLFVLAYWCLKTGQGLWILAAVTVAEVGFGMTGFFADFRETFLVLLIAAAAARPRLSLRDTLAVSGVFAAKLTVTVFWTVIKPDYRDYLSHGAHAQVVDRSMVERLGYVGQAADEFSEDQFQTGLRDLAARISYIDFLAATLKYVPEVRPHENGRLLGDALTNMIEPRIFFPDKPPTPNDTTIAIRYTGIPMDDRGDASISIGYLSELYIDFGYVGAILCSFAIGGLAGFAFRVMRSFRGLPLFFSYGLAAMVLVDFSSFDTDLVRFLGAAITVFLGALVLQRAIAPQVLVAMAKREPRMQAA